MTQVYEARAIANFILDHVSSKGGQLTIMALLKILYFAHGWNLVRTGLPLIKEPVEAWKDGPVVRIVWESFRGQGSEPIEDRATRVNPATGERSVVRYEVEHETAHFVRSMVDAYSRYSAFELSDMTHVPGGPWDRVWNAADGKVRAGMVISNEEIRRYLPSSSRPEFAH